MMASNATTDATDTTDAERLTAEFAGPSAGYYAREFARIGQHRAFRLTFNLAALLLGPIWFAARHLWTHVIIFGALEILAFVTLTRGLFKDLGFDERLRTDRITKTLSQRREQLETAIAEGSDSVGNLSRAVESLEGAIQNSIAAAEAASEFSVYLVLIGLSLFVALRLIQSVVANWLLERHFVRWRSDKSTASGLSYGNGAIAIGLTLATYGGSALHYSLSKPLDVLAQFPANGGLRRDTANAIKAFLEDLTVIGEGFFDGITAGIKTLLDALETVLVSTPWPVIGVAIVLIAWRSAGSRVAIFSAAGLAYIGLLGFWEKAMSTVALLGTASCISIFLGIPVGILCAKKPKVYMFVRPVLDFMQTMPSFVYLIPVIAFFGTGKPAGILATLVFGSPPVIRLTVLGLQSVPETVREAALAFGASPRFLLFKVDLPLAAPTIMAGVNQTIMLSLSMVVVASLIGAKGLGEDVLEALQFAAAGQGILAGLAILFCAMILDRTIQGKKKS
ncbi:ABC transporter permease [Roseovarius sp. 2305UL8-3]|uniref:ABC transporter permease n=1 Tax=Roseovarius conchicola TaxID=3121636 RepID=UPI003528E91E